ncbi:hypothetical protein M0R45_008176 [Rubus argutus]|uniref:NmrA-like domain-containing protein n=1 Tax=Rubus argutus TaxID=59490 RepID=A0AAW1Y0Y7_RUBAR
MSRGFSLRSLETTWIESMLWSQQRRRLLQKPSPEPLLLPGTKSSFWVMATPKQFLKKKRIIGTYTIKVVDDPRTLNKILYIRPPANTISFNELVVLWEKKIGKTLEKIYVPEEQLLKNIQEAAVPINVEPSFRVGAFALYPDVKYTTVDEYLDQFV